MNKEIERKFLVRNTSFIAQAHKHWRIRQGFLMIEPGRCLRIREDADPEKGSKFTLCLKISQSMLVRDEYEYLVPAEDGEKLLQSCTMLIEKERYRILDKDGKRTEGSFWDIDVFHGKNEGLIVAEMELPSEDFPFEKPDWVGEEVTEDPRYLNTNLSKKPFTEW